MLTWEEIILQQGIPFDVKITVIQPLNTVTLTEAQLSVELEKGYADMQMGRTKLVSKVFSEIKRDYKV